MIHIVNAAELPAGPLYIYGTGQRALALADALRLERPDVRLEGFLDTFRDGAFEGLPVTRLERHLSGGGDRNIRVVVASHRHKEIAALLAQADMREPYVFVAQCLPALTQAILAQAPAEQRLTVLDLGARHCEGLDQEWDRLLPASRLRVYGFEPDPKGCAAARVHLEARGVDCALFPVGLWSRKGVIPFYRVSPPTSSSCYPLNEAFVNRLRSSWRQDSGFPCEYPAGVGEIEVDTLDNWWREGGWASPDFAKLDVHGAELEILKGGQDVVGELVGVKCEAWFAEYYLGAPRFSEVELFLRERGFGYVVVPTDYDHPCIFGRRDAPFNSKRLRGYSAHGQTIWSDVLFLRDPVAMSREQLASARFFRPEKMAALLMLCEAFAQYEFAAELARWLPGAFRDLGQEEAARRFETVAAKGLARYRASQD